MSTKSSIRAATAGTLAAVAVLTCGLTARPAAAQSPEARALIELSLAEALLLARQNNPGYLATRNDETAAAWGVREAYANLLPQASVNGGMRYEEGGSALFGSLTAEELGVTESPAYYFSSYGATATWRLSPQTWFNISEERASRRAVEANVDAAETTLQTAVKRSYMAALRARDNVELRRQQLERAEETLSLAETRAASGVAIPLDAKQAAVERGRAQVNVLTARSDYETTRLRLLQQLGVEMGADVVLTTDLEVFEPRWSRAELVEVALTAHPMLRSLEARGKAQRAAARTAWSAYLPTVAAQAGWSGYTRQVGSDEFLLAQQLDRFGSRFQSCEARNDLYSRLADPYPPEDCSGFELTDTRVDSLESAVIAGNRSFPFDFEKQPLSVSLVVSLPIFTGFTRQRQVAQAEVAADDTQHLLRGERLRLTTDVAAAHLRLNTAYQAVQIEETNRALAAEQLEQARERYRVGLDSFVQLTEAQTLKSSADQAYLAGVYTFHEALADLEAAVGQTLRPGRR